MSKTVRRNLLILHTDQQRYDSLGCAGNPHARTPNIDALAAEGTFFSRHIVSNPVCMPSRATLLTGLYPSGHGIGMNGVPLPRREHRTLAPAAPDEAAHVATLADMLSEAGYHTAALGKLHLTPMRSDARYGFAESRPAWECGQYDDTWTGPYCGFREVQLTNGHGEEPCRPKLCHYGHWLTKHHPEVLQAIEASRDARHGAVEGIPQAWLSAVPSEVHHSTWLGQRACECVSRAAREDRPFFLFVGFPDPHHPVVPPEDVARDFLDMPVPEPLMSEEELSDKPSPMRQLMATTGRRNIRTVSPESLRTVARYTAAMVSLIDRAVGRIVERLKQSGQWGDTVVIFTSDHGDWMGDHGLIYKAYCPSHSLLHTPLVLRCPGDGLPRRVDAAVSNADIVPTVLSLLGLPAPDGLHGCDLFAGGERPLPMAQTSAIDPRENSLTVYDDRYRYSCYPQLGEEELYDHTNDPGELVNLAAQATTETRAVCDRLRGRLFEQHARCYQPVQHRLSPW